MAEPSKFVEFFGPCMWKTLHSVSFTYPESPSPSDQEAYGAFFRTLSSVIPCPSCRGHYAKYLAEHPLDLSGREGLSRWVYGLHDDVNRRAHKSRPTFEEVQAKYAGWAEQAPRLEAMPDKKALAVLADPHFSVPVSVEANRSTGGGTFGGGDSTNLFVVLLVVLVVLFALFRTRAHRAADVKGAI